MKGCAIEGVHYEGVRTGGAGELTIKGQSSQSPAATAGCMARRGGSMESGHAILRTQACVVAIHCGPCEPQAPLPARYNPDEADRAFGGGRGGDGWMDFTVHGTGQGA
jgi:hypothetical protein